MIHVYVLQTFQIFLNSNGTADIIRTNNNLSVYLLLLSIQAITVKIRIPTHSKEKILRSKLRNVKLK